MSLRKPHDFGKSQPLSTQNLGYLMQQYWLSEPGQQTKGPLSLSHLEELAKNDRVSPRAKVCLIGNTDWTDLKKIVSNAPKAGLVQPQTGQGSGTHAAYIAPPALPQSASTNKIPPSITPPQITDHTNGSNTNTQTRTDGAVVNLKPR